MTPQTVNAVNLPLQNAINFPAAILRAAVLRSEGADAAVNYGAIGAVIGHEISHSFDDQGAQFDAKGRLRNWWTPADLAHFRTAGEALAAQYDAYEPLPGLHVNGKLTLGENIADVAGLAAAYDAYRAVARRQGRAGDRRLHRRPAVLPRLRADLADQDRRRAAPQRADRRPRAGPVPGADRRATSTPGTRRSTSSPDRSSTSRRRPAFGCGDAGGARGGRAGSSVPGQPLPPLRGASEVHPHRAFGLRLLPDLQAVSAATGRRVRPLRASRGRPKDRDLTPAFFGQAADAGLAARLRR